MYEAPRGEQVTVLFAALLNFVRVEPDPFRATPEETYLDADGKLGVLPGDW
jgi:hypothetical protein